MRFVLTPDWEQGIHDLTDRLQKELISGRQVLWLTSGGSNIAASVKIMQRVPANLSKHLSVSLADERYGPVGHEHSNWTKLLAAGFEPKDATLEPILLPEASFDDAQKHFEALIGEAFSQGMLVIGQLGIGDDGHIAGILPGSPGAEQTSAQVVGYPSDPYTRLSLSFTAIKQLAAGYAFAFGSGKRQALTALASEDLPLTEQPAQILKQLHEAYVYNDQIGG